jgi:3-deoxy-D-manno-octulosonic-acid transferase
MAEGVGGLAFAVYRFAGQLLNPLLPLLLERRAKRGLEDRARRGERLGIASTPAPDGDVIWVHAASVGETNAVLPLIERLTAEGRSIVMTTVTVTGGKIAAERLPQGVVHQFAPVDIWPYVRSFLDHWRPRLAVFVESEVWPVITDELARRSVPHVIVNGHMSQRSFERWRRFGGAAHRVFSRIQLVLAQTDADAIRMRELGATRTEIVGNLKLDAPPPGANSDDVTAVRAQLGGRPVLLAASTHPGEDEIVLDAHRQLAADMANLVTIIVPRHPDRGAAIAAMAESDGIAANRRSAGEPLPPAGGVYVADTLGELGMFFRVASVAFVGGSLVPVGGHNPVEPAALGTAIIHGPHTQNFAPIYEALLAAGGSVEVADAKQLAVEAGRLLGVEGAAGAQMRAAEETLVALRGALDRTLDALQPFLRHGQ